jgi:D-threo-aldose 1-dehydrogenase
MNSAPRHFDALQSGRRPLGRTGLSVTPLGLGAAGLGNLYRSMSDDDAVDVVRCALGLGFDLIDTAPFYGFGLSERRVGLALHMGPHRPVVSTKVGRVLKPTNNVAPPRHGFYSSEPYEPVFDYSYDGILRSHESSLQRLGLDRVDILLCHDLGTFAHGANSEPYVRQFLEGGYKAMLRLREEGTVRAIGLGVNECEICERLLLECDFDCVLLAGRYTLLEQPALVRLMPLCGERGVSVIVGGPFNSGILAGGTESQHAHYNYQDAPGSVVGRVQRISEICRAFSTPVGAAALQFVLAHPQVAAVIPGCSSVEEVRRTSAWMAQRIPIELWDALRAAGLLSKDAPTPP